jgi:hypothetical protein
MVSASGVFGIDYFPLRLANDIPKVFNLTIEEECIIKGMGHDISMEFIDFLADDILRNAGRIKVKTCVTDR